MKVPKYYLEQHQFLLVGDNSRNILFWYQIFFGRLYLINGVHLGGRFNVILNFNLLCHSLAKYLCNVKIKLVILNEILLYNHLKGQFVHLVFLFLTMKRTFLVYSDGINIRGRTLWDIISIVGEFMFIFIYIFFYIH